MATGQYISTPSPQCSHYEQPGIIVPPTSTSNMTVPGSNPVLSNSPCPECALHSTILRSMAFDMQSMDAACHHLHASASCSSCYSNYQLQQQRFALDHGQHNLQVYPGARQYQCGHIQPPLPADPYAPRGDPHLSSEGTSSYPSYQYHEWHPTNVPSSSYLPQQQQIIPSNGPTYQHTTAAPIISLPSPTLSIPSISPYLPSLENQGKIFDLSLPNELIKEGGCQSNSEPGTGFVSQPQHKFQNNMPNMAPSGLSNTVSYTKEYTREDRGNPLAGISGIKITDDKKEKDIKSEEKSESSDSQRKKSRSAEKRKSKSDTKQNSSEVRKRQPEDVCQVCGDRASGYHYNALTCEGCKGFFRRSITNKTSYKQGCKQGGTCEMDTYTRRKCPFCRLKKCREVGMLEECLLTEIQCQSKRRRRKAKQEQQEEIRQEEASPSYSATSPDLSSVTSSPCGSDSSRNEEGSQISLTLTDEERAIIEIVSEAFGHYKINPDIVRRWEKYINKESNKTCRLSDITTVHVQVLVEYTKSLPGFIALDPEDQIALLKGSVMEAILLRNSCGYHHLTREINMRAIIDETGVEATKMAALIDFFSAVGKLEMDEIEYALLIAIVIFNSDYPYVKNKAEVEEYQDQYLSTLAKYSMSREPHRPFIFARILAILTEIRSLSHYHAELVTSWKKRGALTPLLCEIWDLD